MWNVKTLDNNEAVSNPNYGYMERFSIANNDVIIIGDKIKNWSTNTLDQAVTVTNRS